MRKRLLSTLLALCMMLALLPRTAWAADTSGKCGDNLTWSYSNGTLTIEGTGKMDSYYKDQHPSPWLGYTNQIRTIHIKTGVTNIGTYAFAQCNNLTSVTIPNSVTAIEGFAFYGCSSLPIVTIPNSITKIATDAFSYCSSLISVIICPSVTSIEDWAFYGCSSLVDVYYSGSEEDWNAIRIGWRNDDLTNARIHYDELRPVDYLALSDLSYTDITAVSIGKTVQSIIGSQWDNKWKKTDILYSELFANVSQWIVYDYRNNFITGFTAYAFQNPLSDKIVIAYRGSRDLSIFNILNYDLAADWILNDINMFLGGNGSQLQNAFDFYNDVKTKSGCKNIAVTGHSLGGGFADIIAACYNCEGQSFNSAPFLDVAYWHLYDKMSEQFMGVDQFTFWAHVNKDDYIGNWWGEWIKPKIVYAPTRKESNHLLPSIVIRNGDGSVGLGIGEQKKNSSTVTQKATGIDDYVSLGTSKADSLKFQAVIKLLDADINLNYWSDYAVYGGDGDDVIQTSRGPDVISGGKGSDDIDGNRGDDTYIYHRGDGLDVISDISGKDELIVYGFPSNSNVSIKAEDEYVKVIVSGHVIANISKTRSDKKSNSFVVRFDSMDEVFEINDLLTGKVGHAKTVSISCPVNVEVIDDASGTVVHTLYDGQEETSYTQYGNFYVYLDENGEYIKYLDLFEGYSVRIMGVGDGTMDIFMQDISDDLYDPNAFIVEAVPVTNGTIAMVEEDTETGKKTLLIDNDGDGITDTTLPLPEKALCDEGHYWGRGTVSAESKDILIYTCSICGETKYENITPFEPGAIHAEISQADAAQVVLTDPKGLLSGCDKVFYAVYSPDNQLERISAGELDKDNGTVQFTSAVEAGGVLILLDTEFRPICPKVVLSN